MIREMLPGDGKRVLEIYGMGLESGNSTFETILPSWEEWNARHLRSPRLVFESNGTVTGWAALSPFSSREVYKGVAELSIYVASDSRGKNIGSELMEKMISESESEGIWTLVSSVFPENEATIRLHKKSGFREIGKREKIARHKGIWRDTILFERRSPNII